MDLPRMISELQAERDRLSDAILALERLSEANQHKRGRPPKWLKSDSAALETGVNGQAAAGSPEAEDV